MKWTILLLFIFLNLSFSYAQDTLRTSSKERAKALSDRITRDLKLSKVQSQRIHAIMIKRSNDFKRIRDTYGSNPKIRIDSIEEINWQARNAMKKILTEDQFKLFDRLKEETRRQKLIYQQKHSLVKSEEDEEF